MATVICAMTDCVYRSKRKLKNWVRRDGEPCYGCTLDAITVRRVYDPDGDIKRVAGEENMASCAHYKKRE